MKPRITGCLITALMSLMSANALINPAVQPRHFFSEYLNVTLAQVTEVNTSETLSATMEITEVVKGDLQPRSITIASTNRENLADFFALKPGAKVVMFFGKERPRNARLDGIYYAGGGKWYRFKISEEPSDSWTMLGDADAGEDRGSVNIMFGVFNGETQQLANMVRDLAAGTAYFPSLPFTRFDSVQITEAGPQVQGLALLDWDGDGVLDLLASTRDGVRLFLNKGEGKFSPGDVPQPLLDASGSLSVADINLDGDDELLVGRQIFSSKGALLKTLQLENDAIILSGAFVEINGDGLPDIVFSLKDGGLKVFINKSENSAVSFSEATEKLGLGAEEAGAGLSGLFDVGDWDNNGRTDILYLAGPGFLLLNEEEGFRAEQIEADDSKDFGSPALAYIVSPEKMSAILPDSETKKLIEFHPEFVFRDITSYGNEIQDDVPGLYLAVAADFNADGTVDIFIGNKENGSPAMYVDNRGYSSFMLPDKYSQQTTFPGDFLNRPISALVPGDITGDGSNDLVAAYKDGSIRVALNRTLEARPVKSTDSTLLDARKQIDTRLLTAVPTRKKGVIGAVARLYDANSRLVFANQIGGNINVGCSAPRVFSLATREPGAHKLVITYSDGHEVALDVDLGESSPRHQTIKISR